MGREEGGAWRGAEGEVGGGREEERGSEQALAARASE